jgi:hypothetical protein
MIKDFNKTLVLTTQDPGGFLNFRWEPGDLSIWFYIRSDSSIPLNKLYVNGIDINNYPLDQSIGYALYISDSGDPSIASFHVYTREIKDFNYNISIDVSGDGISPATYDVSVLNRPYIVTSDFINIYESSNIQIDGNTSYLVLRTNPKFTGNIKLNVDSSNSLFLDTFKISDILSNKKYRKQPLSSNGVFSGDIRNVFSDLPIGEMYRVDTEDTLNIQLPKTDLFKQYHLNYSYGARLFEDELYDDDYAILSPLWINNTLPDYFAIFRIDGVFNPETYDGSTLDNLANKYFENGKIVKSWGIKEKSPLGIYLRNHLSELTKVISPLFLSLSDPDQKDPDPNTWYGVAVDKGIIAGRSETTYFFDQKSSNFTDLNGFVSQGFERLNLLCPNLLNLEYSFSDQDVSLYTMHRYFGLYLTENPLYEISYYASDPDASIKIISLDGKNSNDLFSSNIFDSSGNISDIYKNRIFTLDDILEIKRITNVNQVNGKIKDDISTWVNKPGDNIFSTQIRELFDLGTFFSFKLTGLLDQGEHLRFVDKTDNVIWEVYALDSDILGAGEYWTYATTYSSPGYPTVFRTAFSIKGTISDQIKAIKGAFEVFKDYDGIPFTPYLADTDSLSFAHYPTFVGHDLYFQRITSQIVNNFSDPSSNFNNVSHYNDLAFYGVFNPTINDFEKISFDSSFGPINFELYGDRMSIMLKIFDSTPYYVYSLDASIVSKFEDNILYLGPDNWYRLVQPLDLSTSVSNKIFEYFDDPTTLDDKIIIMTEQPIVTINNLWHAYGVYPLTVSLMGINPVKDFDYAVYDSSLGFTSNYRYNREGDASTWTINLGTGESRIIDSRGSYEITGGEGAITINGSTAIFTSTSPLNPFRFNTFDNSAFILITSPAIVTYTTLDGSALFKSYKTGYSEESIGNYYQTPNSLLKYGLTVPYVTKWVSTGNDCRNNPLRLILDASIFDVSTNFIPNGNNFTNELSYPSFKYLNTGDRNWEDYIFFDINDVVVSNDGSISNYNTFKDLMLLDPSLDVFSKIIYSNSNVSGTKIRSSIVYYNNYKDSIDGIINGLNLSFKLEANAKNTLNIQDWDRFRISFISVPSRNNDNDNPIEIFINENTESILIVWYQGNDVLNYSKRDSTFLPGKNVLDSSLSDIRWSSFISGNRYYSNAKSPFIVNNSTSSTSALSIYDLKSSYDSSICSPYSQINANLNDNFYSIFNAYGENQVLSGGVFAFFKSYDTFNKYVSYSYFKNTSTYGLGVVNLGYTYMTNSNFYKNLTCDLDVFSYLINRNLIKYYIFKGNSILTSNDFATNPILISINPPRNYKGVTTYNGWYTPNFINMLNFNYNEEKGLADIVKKDFTLGNTDIRSYSNIPQFWYSKVVNQMTAYDVSTQNAINFIKDFNIFKSQWDANYYKISTNGVENNTNGFNSPQELQSFFGSKLIRLPATLVLKNWDSNTSSVSATKNTISLKFNLTRSIVSTFKNEASFIQNWGSLTSSDIVINNYIKTTILNYYNISNTKIKVDIWTKPNRIDNQSYLAFSLTSDFSQLIGTNVEGNLNFENDEYIYQINVNIIPNQQYFVQFTLFEK